MNDARPALVIGYGNSLRGDDAVGPKAASIVQGWGLTDVNALAVTQLTPELAASLAVVRLAIFVDAHFAVEAAPAGVEVQSLSPSRGSFAFGHSGHPRHLLALSQTLYGTWPRAWLLTIPTADFPLGEGLSLQASRGLDLALLEIANLLQSGSFGKTSL